MRLTFICVLLALVFVSGCSSSPFELAHAGLLPDFLDNATVEVREAYRFALANHDEMVKYPCYCGCGPLGHENLFDCYVSGKNPNGSLKFDNHASNCGICVDITRDVMRLLRQGKPSLEIRQYVDETYGKYGNGTDTPMPVH